MIFLLISIKSH
jgi:hypothetical protein